MSDIPANPPRPPPQRILVIDDESVVCHSCRRSLAPDGHEVEVATDPYAGLEVAREGEHDILLLDIVMPGISGLDVFRTLRREGLKAEVILLRALESRREASATPEPPSDRGQPSGTGGGRAMESWAL